MESFILEINGARIGELVVDCCGSKRFIENSYLSYLRMYKYSKENEKLFNALPVISPVEWLSGFFSIRSADTEILLPTGINQPKNPRVAGDSYFYRQGILWHICRPA